MTIRKIPSAPAHRLVARMEKPQAAGLARWSGKPQAAYLEDRQINLYGAIGEDWSWNEDGYLVQTGTTSLQIAEILARVGPGPITINVNSPGGSMFEGLAIYNLIRMHDGEVTVNVVGTAASAASVIVMAADRLNMGKASFLMIHNTWLAYSGNRNDFLAMAAELLPFDEAMAAIYSDRTGLSQEKVLGLMDAESWISGEAAVAQGFADALLGEEEHREAQASLRKPATMRASAEAGEKSNNALAALAAAAESLRLYQP